MPLDAASLIRAGSGFAFIGVGTLALWQAGSPGRRAIGFACISFGAAFVGLNILPLEQTDISYMLAGPFLLGFAVALCWFILRGPWSQDSRTQRQARFVLAGIVVAAVVLVPSTVFYAIAANRPDLAGRTASEPAISLYFLGFMAAILAAAAVAVLGARHALQEQNAQRTRAIAFLSLGLLAYPAYGVALTPFLLHAGPFASLVGWALPVAAAFAWLPVTRTPGGKMAWLVSWGVLGCMLYGSRLWSGTASGIGILRTVAALLVGIAVLGNGLDDRMRTRLVVRRGTLAACALALLFIVAQVAQNFFSAKFGLLTGGVVAGTFLFAASPVQRAIERASERPPSAGGRTASQEEAYKSAVRLALRGGITRAEELELARIADAHGIRAVRAHELRDEVELAWRVGGT